jgi:RNA polymerase sigma-70 factor, ECF subfamily
VTHDNDHVAPEFDTALRVHRPQLLRHCYRMLGSFADAEDLVQETLLRAWRGRGSYAADAPLLNWLMRIATNACLTHLARGNPRHLPRLDHPAAQSGAPYESLEIAHWVTPAPDEELFKSPQEALESRETVALAFIALLQRLPPSQRAVLLLKDVMGWSADEIASGLEQSVSSINSALHRARETMAKNTGERLHRPQPEALREYIRCWEERDLDGLLARMHADIAFSMPPYATWFRGTDAVREFLQGPTFAPFWARGLAARETSANGDAALVWYIPGPDGLWRPHSIHVMRFDGPQVRDATNFIGQAYLTGFSLPSDLQRSQVNPP